jgi:hypothetical protein
MCGEHFMSEQTGPYRRQLRTFTVAAVLLASLPPAAEAQTTQSVCQQVINSYRVMRVCRQVVVPTPAPAPPARLPETSAQRGPGTETTVRYDPAVEAKKARARASEPVPAARDVCPPPYRMTERDGCQAR